MAYALVVEDGTGIPDADAYFTPATFHLYLKKQGLAIPDEASDDDVEAAIRRGCRAIDLLYGDAWLGQRHAAGQGMDWPRRGVTVDGALLPVSPLPRALVYAGCEAAWREASQPGVMVPDRDNSTRVTSETVGPISVSYAAPTDAEQQSGGVTFDIIDRLLNRLVDDSGGGLGRGGSTFYLSRA